MFLCGCSYRTDRTAAGEAGIIRVGIDLVRTDRFEFIRGVGGRSFYLRVYTKPEQEAYGDMLSDLAACFAGKEAVSKILGTGLSLGSVDRVSCSDIEILYSQQHVLLSNQARGFAQQLGLVDIVVRFFVASSCVCAIAGGTTDIALHNKMLECIESAGRDVTSRLIHSQNM